MCARTGGATADGRPTIVFRQGEYVPYIAVKRSGGAGASKQFENVAPPEEVVQRGTPVDLRLLYERRLLPALIGQVHATTTLHHLAPPALGPLHQPWAMLLA